MKWSRGPVLGRGSSATVSSATTTSGDLFAVKSVDIQQAKILQKEQHFLSIFNSPYVVSYKGCDITTENYKTYYNIFMDYMSRGSITDSINHRINKRFNDLEIARYTRHVVQGLEYIHSIGIVHCDIKGRNILIDEFGAKIGDFGCAKWCNQMAPITGTPMFMAPEVARGEEQGFPADIWAVGCTVIEMYTGGSPWPEVNDPASVLYKIGFSGEIPRIPDEICDEGKDFVAKCLIRDPKQRWSASELLKHPFVQQLDGDVQQIVCETIGSDSPTSVLDQAVWDSMRESSSSSSLSLSLSSVGIDYGECDGFLLRQRIEQLACKSEMGNWGSEKEDGDWVTIRVNGDGDGGR